MSLSSWLWEKETGIAIPHHRSRDQSGGPAGNWCPFLWLSHLWFGKPGPQVACVWGASLYTSLCTLKKSTFPYTIPLIEHPSHYSSLPNTYTKKPSYRYLYITHVLSPFVPLSHLKLFFLACAWRWLLKIPSLPASQDSDSPAGILNPGSSHMDLDLSQWWWFEDLHAPTTQIINEAVIQAVWVTPSEHTLPLGSLVWNFHLMSATPGRHTFQTPTLAYALSIYQRRRSRVRYMPPTLLQQTLVISKYITFPWEKRLVSRCSLLID